MERRSLNSDNKKRASSRRGSAGLNGLERDGSRVQGRFRTWVPGAVDLRRLVGDTVGQRLTSLRGEPVHYRAPYGGATSS